MRIEDGEQWAEGHGLKIIGTSAKSGDGIDAVFDDMLNRMTKGKSEFFNQKARERGATISLNKKDVQQTSSPGGKGGKTSGKKKKKCC